MKIWREIAADFQAPLQRDPAVGHWLEVILAYPGVHAVVAYRFIHRLERAGMPILPRVLAHAVRCATGIEIHPAAKLGAGLFIDHGMGVVIGSTTVVGEQVTIYQGVTLGGTSLARAKRHPTLGDDVVVGVGAAVLGDITVGSGARIGAGAVVVKDVPPGSSMVGIPARDVTQNVKKFDNGKKDDDLKTHVRMPDITIAGLVALEERLTHLAQTIRRLESRIAEL